MRKFKAKPYTVQAIQFTGHNAEEVLEAVGGLAYRTNDLGDIAIYTTLGETQLQIGQWVVRDGLRTTAMTNEAFRKKFEEAGK